MDEAGSIASDPCDTAQGGGWQRADVRESMLLMASLVTSDRPEPITLRIRNLSAGGLMGECGRAMIRGEMVTVDLPRIGPVTGRIAWVEAGRIGVRFDRAIDPRATRRPVGGGLPTSRIIVPPPGSRPGFR